MAFPAWAAAAIQGGAGITAPIINGLMTQRANHDAMMYNQSMYWMQLEDERKNWNLQNQYNEGLWNKQNEYNERMWAKMNDYNSPMAQMKRFKEAGLNPNLIYGGQTSSPAISTAQQRSSSLSTPTPKGAIPTSWDFTPMSNAIGNSLSTYMQMKESAARTNNLEAQNNVLKQEEILKATDIAGKGIANATNQFELDKAKQLRQTSIDAAEASLKQQQQSIDLAMQRNQREGMMNAQQILESNQRIKNMSYDNINKHLDSQLKTMQLGYKMMGIEPSDNIIFRIMARMWNESGANTADFMRWLSDQWRGNSTQFEDKGNYYQIK